MATRILLVDDDPTILDAFTVYFSSTDNLEVTGTSMTGRQALQWLDTYSCDLVLSDIHMPDIDGIELLQSIQQFSQPPLFVAMTAFDTDETMLTCLSLGAVGYIIKGQTPESIIVALRNALHGGTALPSQCLRRLLYLKTLRNPETTRKIPSNFTESEHRVFLLLLQGLSNKEIARALHYSESTIKQKVSSILRKSGARSRAELIAESHHCPQQWE